VEYTETELISLAKAFDQHALAMIYDRYSTALFQYAYRQLGDQQMAEDCVAETFTRFLQALKKNKGPREHLQSYLYRIAHNWITDQFRKKIFIADGFDEQIELIESKQKDVEAAVLNRLNAQQLREFLRELTAEQRQVIVLKHLENMNNEEVAEIMQKNVGSVKALNSRGLVNLRKMIDRQGAEYER
jgi:RNA polymerase sigma-70 factor (ECF subfamily)